MKKIFLSVVVLLLGGLLCAPLSGDLQGPLSGDLQDACWSPR